ncbi:MAG: hypothetical protein EOO05_04005 [Chitinophagaceae bacterium]|nr:MAG: hypothetical protein EOO05_04005 [Chitinophagaceae bacterium]
MNRFLLTGVLMLTIYGRLFSQNIDATIATYAEKFPQEKAYLHYDKTSYAPGETVWFKVYMMEGINPATESKNFYIDWTDEKGTIISRTVAPVVDGVTNGQFLVPADYTGRFVHAKGYTRWMLNFDSTFLYQKDIRIISNTAAQNNYKNTQPTSIGFFPEGGDAVAGFVNKVAFKANDQWGRPVKVSGTIVNQAGKTVDSLRTMHNGMGYFFLNPKEGDSFTAKWKDEKGVVTSTPLPSVKTTGVGLQVSTVAEKKYFQVNVSPGAQYKMLHVIGTMNQYQVFKVSKDVTAGEFKGVIPVSQLPSGILTITVFDDTWKAIAERIVFVNNDEYRFVPEFTVEHWGLNKRARNDLQVTVPDSLIASLSISVTDADIDTDSSHTIISDLLLSSDIRGQVFDPASYFTGNADSQARKVDLVMLTHGWRRFKWDDVAKGKLPQLRYQRDTSYMVLSGRVFGALPSQIKEAGSIILIVKQKDVESNGFKALPLNADGTFRDPETIIFDSANIYYQLMKAKGVSDVSVNFFEDKLPPFKYNDPAKGIFFNPSKDTLGFARHARLADQTAKLLKKYEGELLANVIVKSKTKSPVEVLDERYTSGLFSGGDSYNFDMTNDPFANSATNIFTYLQGKVAGLQINNAQSQQPSLSWRGQSPGVYLNEMQTDLSMIATLPVSDVAYIKVFRPPFMGGFNGAGGAIAIYTKKGGDQKSEPGKGLSNNTVTGYTMMREFYSPNYASFKPENERADVRTTLYWNPQLQTAPGKNKVLVSFYNNDLSKSFRVVIEGMTADGRLAHIEEIME